MKTPYFLLLFVLTILWSACQQNSNVNPSIPNNFIEFEEDGTFVRYEFTTPESFNSITQALNGVTSTLVNSSYNSYNNGQVGTIGIALSSNRAALGLNEYQNMVGQKIPLGICTTNNCLQAFIVRNTSNKAFTTEDGINSLPDNYFKVTAVKYHSNDANYGDLYEIQGEFNAKLVDSDNNPKSLTNGKFQMLYQSY